MKFDMSITLKRNIVTAFVALAVLAALLAIMPLQASAATTCAFANDLAIGSVGEDVRCLQQYLNSSGFVVATGGVGSAGHETTQFQTKTQAAVMKWQTAQGISPASGLFGPLSRAKYAALTDGSVPTIPPATVTTTTTVDPNAGGAAAARAEITEAINSYENALEKAQNADTDDVDSILEKARVSLLDAVIAFIDNNFVTATSLARTSRAHSEIAYDEIGSDEDEDDGDEEDAQDAVDEAQDDLDDAWDDFDAAEEDDEDTGDAEDLLEKADDLLDDAENALDDEDWDDAMDLADDAQDLIDEALDEF